MEISSNVQDKNVMRINADSSSFPLDPGGNLNFHFNLKEKESHTRFTDITISVLTYSNLDNKVLFEGGSVVVNQCDFVRTYHHTIL